MSVSTRDISKLADLSRLQFTESEIVTLQGDMNWILDLIDKLSSVDTSDVLPDSSLFPHLSHSSVLSEWVLVNDSTILSNAQHPIESHSIVVWTTY